ncbi:hypothetical protein GOV07_04655 [Candidatus Woesearchaeota archaeon]|nr:hypothetical protein [Candidatus Woesearchaeota archaeon]
MATKKRSHAHKKAVKESEKTETATKKESSSGDIMSRFSPGFLHGAILVLALLVIISGYMLGFQYGKLSVMEGSAPASTAQPSQAAAPAPTQAAPQPTTPPPPTVPKTAKPEVELFIMSYCPYGLQMQKAYVQAEELLSGKADMKVKWVNYAMHGLKEIEDNTREYCIQKEQPDKWLAFEKCFVETTDYSACAAKTSVDTSKVDSCYASLDAEYGLTAAFEDKASWLSGRYPKYTVNDDLNKKYGVRGSPTLVINGEQVKVSRSAEAVKQAICNAFTTPPAECNTKLNANQEQPGAGPIGAGSAPAAAPSAGCGA